MTHVTTADAGRWVAGLLEGPEAAALEAHVAGCPECEARLQREAAVELKLGELALRSGPARGARRWAGRLVPLAAAAALALAFVRGLVAPQASPDAGAPPPSHVLSYEVPRYEGGAQHEIMRAPAGL